VDRLKQQRTFIFTAFGFLKIVLSTCSELPSIDKDVPLCKKNYLKNKAETCRHLQIKPVGVVPLCINS
jgi:hypothetical protein